MEHMNWQLTVDGWTLYNSWTSAIFCNKIIEVCISKSIKILIFQFYFTLILFLKFWVFILAWFQCLFYGRFFYCFGIVCAAALTAYFGLSIQVFCKLWTSCMGVTAPLLCYLKVFSMNIKINFKFCGRCLLE